MSTIDTRSSANMMSDTELATEEDDWVVVKKQRIIFLVPPPSPPHSQAILQDNEQTNVRNIIQRTSDRLNKPCQNSIQIESKAKRHATVPCGNGAHDHEILNKKLRGLRRILGASKVVNLQIRAANLERNLHAFGGLRKWLVSLGLAQFTVFLQREKLSVYQLVSLTMSKLKDMGIYAVGPRRKLIHAIDCLCQPHYIKALL